MSDRSLVPTLLEFRRNQNQQRSCNIIAGSAASTGVEHGWRRGDVRPLRASPHTSSQPLHTRLRHTLLQFRSETSIEKYYMDEDPQTIVRSKSPQVARLITTGITYDDLEEKVLSRIAQQLNQE